MKKRLGIFGLALAGLLMLGTAKAQAGVRFGVSVGPAYPVYPYAYQYPYPSYYPYAYSPYYSPYASYPYGGYSWGGGVRFDAHRYDRFERHDRGSRSWNGGYERFRGGDRGHHR
jgi:hypothetical protein